MDMKLSDAKNGKTSTPNAASSSAREAPPLMPTDRSLCKDQWRELQKRLIKEAIVMSWLQRKQLEEEVMVELFGEDILKVKSSLVPLLDHPQAEIETGHKLVSDASKTVLLPSPLQLSLSSSSPSPLSLRVEAPLVGLIIQGGASLNNRDGHDERPRTHVEDEMIDDYPFQRHPVARDKTKPKMLINLVKRTSTPFVDAVKECASDMVNKVGAPLVGGDDEGARKTVGKRKPLECELEHMKTNSQQLHVAKKVALTKTSTPVTSSIHSSGLLLQVTKNLIALAASAGNTLPNIAEHVKENLKAQPEDRNKLSSGSPVAGKHDEPTKHAAFVGNTSPAVGDYFEENIMAQLENFSMGPPLEEKHETISGKAVCGTKRKIAPVEKDCDNETASANYENRKQKKWECELCQMEMNSEHQFTSHLNGKYHLKNKTRQLAKATKASIEEHQAVAKFESCKTMHKIWLCKMCKFETTTEEAMRDHRTRDQHMALLDKCGGDFIAVNSIPDGVPKINATYEAAESNKILEN